MFAKFQITLDEVQKFNSISVYNVLRQAEENDWYDYLLQLCEGENGIVDGDRLQKAMFPLLKEYNVFISHSHADINIINTFKRTLEQTYGVKCFVDSLVWENIDSLQKKIDEKYCSKHKNGDHTTYDYDERNVTTSHVHAMLSMALMEMINHCECCIFIQSEKSVVDLNKMKNMSTFSPWIFEEIAYMNRLNCNIPDRYFSNHPQRMMFSATTPLSESYNQSRMKMSHPIKIDDGFVKLKYDDLVTMSSLSYRGYGFLNYLYYHYGLITKDLYSGFFKTDFVVG